ncbi:MAG TPA: hypothetical protein VMH86_10900 [Rhizomicrobium sp.]|nr:hypothetical protein [Rhizomicrobium sp.]
MRWVLWTATVLLATLAGVCPWMADPGWMAYTAALLFAGAAILLIPALWRDRWRYPRYVAALILTVVALQLPIKTHAVKLDMPHAASSR